MFLLSKLRWWKHRRLTRTLLSHPDYFHVGNVIRPSGYTGEILVHLDVDDPEKYAGMLEVWEGKEGPEKKYDVESVSLNKNSTAVLKLKGIDLFEEAQKFSKTALWLPLSFLPPLTGKLFYVHEIIGFEVHDTVKGNIGLAKGVLDLPMQKLLEIDHHGKEVLLPLQPEFYLDIDRDRRILLVSIPDGLLDVYTSGDRPV